MEQNQASCPLCNKPINIHDMDWKCPACETLNEHRMYMANCEWCRFAPHFLNCPHCKEDFDLWLITGGYKDSSGKPINESGRKIIRPAIHQFKVSNLNNGFFCEVDENAKRFFTNEFMRILENFEFTFPDVVRCIAAHTVFVSEDDRLWMHQWLFANEKPRQNKQPLGQLIFVYPGRTHEKEKDYTKIDCPINESWW